MPIRLIGILIVAVAVTLFSAFNLQNKCDVWLFYQFKDIPVAVTIMVSLFAGVIITLPFTFGRRVKRGEVLVKKTELKKQANLSKQNDSVKNTNSAKNIDSLKPTDSVKSTKQKNAKFSLFNKNKATKELSAVEKKIDEPN